MLWWCVVGGGGVMLQVWLMFWVKHQDFTMISFGGGEGLRSIGSVFVYFLVKTSV